MCVEKPYTATIDWHRLKLPYETLDWLYAVSSGLSG